MQCVHASQFRRCFCSVYRLDNVTFVPCVVGIGVLVHLIRLDDLLTIQCAEKPFVNNVVKSNQQQLH